jgi:hypothetical protein
VCVCVLRVTVVAQSTDESETIGEHGAVAQTVKRSQVAPEPQEGQDLSHGHKKSKHSNFFKLRAIDHKVCVSQCVCMCVCVGSCVFHFHLCCVCILCEGNSLTHTLSPPPPHPSPPPSPSLSFSLSCLRQYELYEEAHDAVLKLIAPFM